MAFGFTPHFETGFYLNQLTPQQFLVLSLDIARDLGWNVIHVSDAGFIALTYTAARVLHLRIASYKNPDSIPCYNTRILDIISTLKDCKEHSAGGDN